MLEIDLNEQIKKHLPAQVGDVLKSRLELADRAEELQEELKQERKRHKETQVQGERMSELERERFEQITALTKELEEFKAREEKLRIDEHVMQAKLDLIDRHRTENLEVVKAVFQNNRLKYREHGNIPIAVEGFSANQYNTCGSPGHVEERSFDKTVEQET